MGPRAPLTRRGWLQQAAAWPLGRGLAAGPGLGLAGCSREAPLPPLQGDWVGASHRRGHALREALPAVAQATTRRATVLVLGGGIAGLAAARGLVRAGVDDVQVLELEDGVGGNSRGHQMAGLACPLGAHYLPVPGEPAHEVTEWLHEIGLLQRQAGRSVPDERQLCHSPQERLWFDGAWHEGLLPPADPASATQAQYQRFAQAVQRLPAFALPAHRAPWTATHADLDGQTFARWLDTHHFTDARLRWYLDYACRDDYGAGLDVVSAWAGLHYFASRHGFHAPGDADVDRDPVFTWPEGNARLVQHLATPLAGRLHGGRVVRQVTEQRHGVQVLVQHDGGWERWAAGTVVLALPLGVALRVLANPPDALRQAAAATAYAPWLVANLLLDKPLVDRAGVPPAWDSVAFGSAALGYVNATHQTLNPVPGATVLTAYRTLPLAQRGALLQQPWAHGARQVVDEMSIVHPDLPLRLQRVDLVRWGHAMAVPRPGLQHSAAARAALRGGHGRVRFAHADLAGYSVFEEAFTAGCDAARAAVRV